LDARNIVNWKESSKRLKENREEKLIKILTILSVKSYDLQNWKQSFHHDTDIINYETILYMN
jgi:hypothetical protein